MNRQAQKLSLSKETLFNLQYGIQALGETDYKDTKDYTCGRPSECWGTCPHTCKDTCTR